MSDFNRYSPRCWVNDAFGALVAIYTQPAGLWRRQPPNRGYGASRVYKRADTVSVPMYNNERVMTNNALDAAFGCEMHAVTAAARDEFLDRIGHREDVPPPPRQFAEPTRSWSSSSSAASSQRSIQHGDLRSDDDDDDSELELVQLATSARQRVPVRDHVPQAYPSPPPLPLAAADVPPRAPPPPPPPPAALAHLDADVTQCPLCHEELPYMEDVATSTAMANRLSDLHRVIFRFERMLVGRVHDESVFYGMLQLRRLLVEQHLEQYSNVRFQRWSMAILRNHYSPHSGHRFDYVRSLDTELRELEQVRAWIMEHAMFVDHPELGDRVFNLRAVDQRLRLSRAYTDTLKLKMGALHRPAQEMASDTNMVMEAISAASTMAPATARKRAREAGTGALADQYDLGGL